jgi:hypothetical protein
MGELALARGPRPPARLLRRNFKNIPHLKKITKNIFQTSLPMMAMNIFAKKKNILGAIDNASRSFLIKKQLNANTKGISFLIF